MNKLPETKNSLLLRTDFSDETAWRRLCEDVVKPSADGFRANVDCVSDRAFDGMTVEGLVALSPPDGDRSFAFVADWRTVANPEQAILVVDLYDQPGRTFRVIPREMWGVENNLSLGNMDYSDFADNVDADGVFRGFPET